MSVIMTHSLRNAARHMRGALDGLGAAKEAAPRVAVILPCHNEAAAIARVIGEFQAALPEARVIVFDNASSDATAAIAAAAGAEVHFEPRPGKGNVVRRMFADIDADIYLMADGDGTYDAASAPLLVACVAQDNVDMAIGARAMVMQDAHRRGHAIGNRLFNRLYHALFGAGFEDIFSGYRAFSRRFVKSFPALSSGFEIETELCVHASQLKLPTAEIILPYGKRDEGSSSKLRTFRDGLRILSTFAVLLKETRPALFFGSFAGAAMALAIALAIPIVTTFIATGLVPRIPTVVLCTGLTLFAALMGACGLILDSLARSRVEQKRILYLTMAAPRA
ncbi:glycosyltransferase [Methylocapsa sp. S129]|uniref:glycosyltransferase n=1 Tax=Methylocapsa sp. S129 TaxID=1641869 RepID=UPI001FEE89F0|nr:glycosyltransferase [Methylocapsa sp. S129]